MDEDARIRYAAQDGEVVPTCRLYWGGDAPFTETPIEEYQLAPFLEELPRDAMAVGDWGLAIAALGCSGGPLTGERRGRAG